MGDIEGSSRAAQSAQSHGTQKSLVKRVLTRLFGGPSDGAQGDPSTNANAIDKSEIKPDMLNLRHLRVDDVAIPKAEIVAVPDSITRDDLVEVFRSTGMTRIPVYGGTLDTPVGMIHLKDFSLKHGFDDGGNDFNLAAMLRPLLFVPPSMSLGVLLTKMQTERRHMALVIDEYGGVDGLVTIEDLIEQVVGEIEDEHDIDEAQSWHLEKPGQYVLLAKASIEEFARETGLDLTQGEDIDAEEIDTFGGLIFVLAGRVPVRGEVVRHPLGAEFEIMDADPRRVKRLRLRLPELVQAAE
jgi:magnesium and cobalt transporter